jgi:hypothetical protein
LQPRCRFAHFIVAGIIIFKDLTSKPSQNGENLNIIIINYNYPTKVVKNQCLFYFVVISTTLTTQNSPEEITMMEVKVLHYNHPHDISRHVTYKANTLRNTILVTQDMIQ